MSLSVRLKSLNDTATTLEAPSVDATAAASAPRFCAATHRRIFLFKGFDPKQLAECLLPTLMWSTCTSHTVAEPPGPGVEAPVSGTRKNERCLIFRFSSVGM